MFPAAKLAETMLAKATSKDSELTMVPRLLTKEVSVGSFSTVSPLKVVSVRDLGVGECQGGICISRRTTSRNLFTLGVESSHLRTEPNVRDELNVLALWAAYSITGCAPG